MPTPHAPTTRTRTWVTDYFERHLGSRMNRELLPGLRSLSTAFTIQVEGGARWAVAVEGGRITRVDAGSTEQLDCHVSMGREDFARIVSGQATPQSLFVRRRLKIAGNVLRALEAASAMEEFFRRFPYTPPAGEETR